MKGGRKTILVVGIIAIFIAANFLALTSNMEIPNKEASRHGFVRVKDGKLYYLSNNRAEIVPGTENDIVAGVKYFTQGNVTYVLYQDYSIRCGNLKYMTYNGKWSLPLVVGRDYGDFTRFNGVTYIISSDMTKVYLTVIGDSQSTVTLSDNRAVATAIGVVDGMVYGFWADVRGRVYQVSAENPTDSRIIYNSDGSIYRLSINSGKLSIIERVNGYEIQKDFIYSQGSWVQDSKHTLRSPTKTMETRTIDDEFHQRQNQTGRWVMIVYLNGDNNLGDNSALGGEYDVGDLNEMESEYNDSNVGLFDIVVLWDHKGSDDPNTHVLWIRHDTNGAETTDSTDTVASPKLDSYYPLLANDADHELYLSNYSVFVDFVEWVVENFPAEHYFVDMWDHGGGYDGVMWDDDAGGDSWPHDHITLRDMHDATLKLYNDLYFKLNRTLDIIGYDTCLTDHGGIQYHNKIMFDYVGASEHTEGGYGWSYDTVLDEMVTTQGQITADKQAYNLAYHANDDGGIVTYAVVNTTLWDYKWMPAYNALAQAMKHKAGTENTGIKDAFSNSADADSRYWTTAHDYWDMINNHIIGDGEISDPTILYWAHRCVENMTRNSDAYSPGKMIPYSYDSDTNNVKLMMAESTDKNEINDHVGEAWIFKENQWDEMINQVDAGTDVNNDPPTVTLDSPADQAKISKTVGVVRISGTASDSDGSVQVVQVKIDRGYWQNATGTDNWYYDWDISNMPCGWHHIMVRSYDGTDFSWEWKAIDVEIVESAPDLTITNISTSTSSVNEGDSVTIYATVKNVGTENATGVYVGFYYDSISSDTHIGNVSVGNLSVGESKDISITWDTTNHAGTHDIIAFADPDNNIPELKENNNTATTSVTVNGYGVSLSVDSSSKSVQPGDTATYTITVTNTGTMQDTFDLSTSSVSNGWSATLSTTQVTLDAGASTTVTLNVTSPSTASQGDSQNVTVTAVSEGDSTKSDSVTTTTTVAIFSVTSITIYNHLDAVINFTTSDSVKTYIVYGIGPNHMNMQTPEESSAGTNHEIAIQNLTPGIKYFFKIHMSNGTTEAWSDVYNFTLSGFNDLEYGDNPQTLYNWDMVAWDTSTNDPVASIWQWGEPTAGPSGAYSGRDVLATNLSGDYGVDNHADALLTPWIDLTNATWATLSFYAWYDLEDGYDGVLIAYQNESSDRWWVLDENNNASQYDKKISTSYGSPIGGYYAFTGSTNGWVQKVFNTTTINDAKVNRNLLGHKVRFIFYFASDSSVNNYYGIAIDDVQIKAGLPLYHIYGYVKDASGNPVSGATVWVNDTTLGLSYEVTTDSNGRYDVYTYNGMIGDNIIVEAKSDQGCGSNNTTLSSQVQRIDVDVSLVPEFSAIPFVAGVILVLFLRRKR